MACRLSLSLSKKRFRRWCFPDSYLKFLTTTFLKRKKALLWEKKHCYNKRGSDIYRKSNYVTFYVISPRILYFSKELAQFIVTAGYIYSFMSRKKSLEVVNNTLTTGFWRSLTGQNSHVDISPLGRLDWFLCTAPTKRFISWVFLTVPHLFYQML